MLSVQMKRVHIYQVSTQLSYRFLYLSLLVFLWVSHHSCRHVKLVTSLRHLLVRAMRCMLLPPLFWVVSTCLVEEESFLVFFSELSLTQQSTSSLFLSLLSASIFRIHSRVWSSLSSSLYRQLDLSLRKASRQQREEDLLKEKVKSEIFLLLWPGVCLAIYYTN